MRVLMLAPAYPPDAGGVQRHVQGVSRMLARRGHQVCVVTRSDRGDLAAEVDDDGVRVLRVLPPPGSTRTTNACVRRWLRRHRQLVSEADFVHAHDYVAFTSWLLPSVPERAWKRWFLTFHGYERYPLSQRDILLRRLSNRLAEGTISVGGFIDRWYRTRSTHVTHGAVDRLDPAGADRWAAWPDAVPGVAFVGRLAADTSVLLLLDALASIPKRERPALRVLGDGPLRAEAERRASALELNAEFLGWLADPWPCIAPGTIVVPSGYLTILEASSRNLPVLALYADPLREDYYRSLPHAGRGLLLAGSPAEAVAALARLIQDSPLRRRLALAGRAWAVEQSWERLTSLYLQLWSIA